MELTESSGQMNMSLFIEDPLSFKFSESKSERKEMLTSSFPLLAFLFLIQTYTVFIFIPRRFF
jgi:hypothetical protein